MTENREKTEKKQATGGRFRPGQSGNPGGRPKLTKERTDALEGIRALAPTVPSVLRDLLTSKDTPAAVKARVSEMVLERTYGKAEALVRVDDSREDVLADIRETVERIQAATGHD